MENKMNSLTRKQAIKLIKTKNLDTTICHWLIEIFEITEDELNNFNEKDDN